MWQLCRDAILTRENMKKQKWPGAPICSFCRQVETNDHLFFTCNTSKVVWAVLATRMGANCVPKSFWQAMAWFHTFAPGCDKFYVVTIAAMCWKIWNVRNKIPFEKHIMRSPSEITFFSISLLMYWAGLQKMEDKECLTGGVNKMMHAAKAVYARRAAAPAPGQMLMITGA